MSAFATTTAAEDRAKAKTLDNTWIEAHCMRTANGTIGVRVLRPMQTWVEITDDATT